MDEAEYLYHYTTVDVLALILKNRTIRLRPLNLLDDPQEEMNQDAKAMGHFCFVSSWKNNKIEMIPMWKMYTKDTEGVRIQLRKNPFQVFSYDDKEFSKYVDNPNHLCIETSVPLEDVFNRNYCVSTYLKDKQLQQIEYTDDDNLLKPQLWYEDDSQIKMNYGVLGKYKNTYWSFQDEWRYIINILPTTISRLIVYVRNEDPYLVRLMRDISDGKYDLPFDHYDLNIDGSAFSEMKILLAPNITEGNKLIVETLVKNFNPSAVIEESSLKGLIR